MARFKLGNIKGPKGDRGEQGPKGDPFRYSDFTQEQLNALKGPKGDKGDEGIGATADNAYHALLAGNVWCKSAGVDDVLTALIGNMGKTFPRTEFKPLTIGAALLHQTKVLVNGEPHYKVKVVATNTVFEIQDNGEATITIPELGEDNVALEYHNLAGKKIADSFIPGAVTRQADEVYDNTVGVRFLRFGRKLVLKLNSYNETSFNWLGKWSKAEIDTLEMEADTPKLVKDLDHNTRNKYDGLTFIIGKPNNIRLAVDYTQGTVVINTPTSTQAVNIDNNDIGWNGRQYEQYGL